MYGVNQDAAWTLVNYGFVAMWAWFYIGIVVSLFYHISLYVLDGDFGISSQRTLDLFVSVLRGLLYVFIWPAIFFFDTTALHRIKLLLLWLNPKERETNFELKMYMKERAYRQWVTRWFSEQSGLEAERKAEAATSQQRKERLKVLHEGNAELDHTWMLTGVGSSADGVHELVRMCPEYYLPDEVAAKARLEVAVRRSWSCLRCRTPLDPEKVEIPELQFLRVVEPGTGKLVIEGWALTGRFTMHYPNCPRCSAEQPPMSEEVSLLGRASDVVRQVKEGMTFYCDLP